MNKFVYPSVPNTGKESHTNPTVHEKIKGINAYPSVPHTIEDAKTEIINKNAYPVIKPSDMPQKKLEGIIPNPLVTPNTVVNIPGMPKADIDSDKATKELKIYLLGILEAYMGNDIVKTVEEFKELLEGLDGEIFLVREED